MIHWLGRKITSNPFDMLWHVANGDLTMYPDLNVRDEVRWCKFGHRGIQFLDKVQFPAKQKRYIFSPRFELRINAAFDEVVEECARPRFDGDVYWLIPPLMEAYRKLHRMGYAHTFETWEGGRLVGGALFTQVGGFLACDTMFHRSNHASKAAWGQALVHLRGRGFEWIDTNCVAQHHVNYGEEWVPQWRFEQMLRQAISQRRSIADGLGCAPLPARVRAAVWMARGARRVGRAVAGLWRRRGDGFAHCPIERANPKIQS